MDDGTGGTLLGISLKIVAGIVFCSVSFFAFVRVREQARLSPQNNFMPSVEFVQIHPILPGILAQWRWRSVSL